MYSHARLAQSVERWTLNPTVVGSSPTLGGFFWSYLYLTHILFSRQSISRSSQFVSVFFNLQKKQDHEKK